MQLHHFNFPYCRDCRITLEQAEAVVELCRAQGCRTVGVYGMGSAGELLAERLPKTPGLRLAGCYDLRHEVLARTPAGQHHAILPPEAMADAEDLDCVLNTTPPTFLVDVAETVARLRPQVLLLNLYDPFAYLDALQDDPYKLYLQLSRPRKVPDEVAALAEAMTARLRAALANWYDRREPPATQRAVAYNEIVSAEQQCLGLHLQARLEECMALAPAARVPALLALAEAFPFFTLARDAAACLLTQAGDFQAAVDAFRPAVDEYPHCHRTREKLAELLLLANAPQEACSDFDLGAGPDSRRSVLERWTRRRVLPPLHPRKRIRLRITTPVWGASYLDLFLRVTVPSLLASGNIPHAARFHDVCYTLYTGRDDMELVLRHPAWQEVARLVPVELVCVEDVDAAAGPGTGKHRTMSNCHSDALRRSREDDRFTFLTLGDTLFSSRYIACSLDYVLEGYDAVLSYTARFSVEDVLAHVVPRYVRGDSIEIEASTLMVECVPYLHPSHRNYLDGPGLPQVPNTYYAMDSRGNLLQHVFARNPMFLAPLLTENPCQVAIDSDLPYVATDGGLGRYALVRDTSKIAMLELTSRDVEANFHLEGQPDHRAFAHWLHLHTDPVNRYFGAHTVVFCAGNGPDAFHDGQCQLAKTVNRLLA